MTAGFAATAALATAAGCRKDTSKGMSFRMGERAAVGRLFYNATQATWKQQLGDGPDARIPQHRFLILHLTVTNSGAAQVGLPLLTLVDLQGKEYREVETGQGVDDWMGLLRTVSPGGPLDGSILFDVSPASYKLRITDGGLETEQIAYIDIPLQMESDPVLSEPPAIPTKQ